MILITFKEKHHICFKSQGGLDFELNYKYLTPEEHRGSKYGVHHNEEVDTYMKEELELNLRKVLVDKRYTVDELIELLGLKEKQAYKAFKRVKQTKQGMAREDIIFRLMGNRFYL